jgi:hypothetical protein
VVSFPRFPKSASPEMSVINLLLELGMEWNQIQIEAKLGEVTHFSNKY